MSDHVAEIGCPHCGHPASFVVDTRGTWNGTAIRRRRACSACSQRYTTYEGRADVIAPGRVDMAALSARLDGVTTVLAQIRAELEAWHQAWGAVPQPRATPAPAAAPDVLTDPRPPAPLSVVPSPAASFCGGCVLCGAPLLDEDAERGGLCDGCAPRRMAKMELAQR